MKINLAQAKTIVNKKLESLENKIGGKLVLIENATIEKEYYWVFFYNSKIYLETGNISYALAGNSPIFFDKVFGEMYEPGTAYPIEFYIEDFEKTKLPILIKAKC